MIMVFFDDQLTSCKWITMYPYLIFDEAGILKIINTLLMPLDNL
jgi:hypothetical protein